MHTIFRSASAVFLFIFFSCRLVTTPDDREIITSLRFVPSAFDSYTRNTEIRYALTEHADVAIRIVATDSTGQFFLVKAIVTQLEESAGSHGHTWLGDTFDGHFAPAGIYFGVVEANGRRYETMVQVFHL